MRYLAAITMICLAAGCATPNARASEGAASAPITLYVEGPSVGTLPTGRTVPNGDVLARRTLDPATRRIVEQVVAADGRRSASECEVVMTVEGTSFTMKESNGGFEGDGTLEGTPWRWSVWRSTSRLPDGTRVESLDSRSADGLTARKRVINRDGAVVIQTVERLRPISAERFAERRSGLLGRC
jgi:hypothetical protein